MFSVETRATVLEMMYQSDNCFIKKKDNREAERTGKNGGNSVQFELLLYENRRESVAAKGAVLPLRCLDTRD